MPQTAIDPITEAEIWLRATLLASDAVTAVYGNKITTHPGPRALGYPILTFFCLTPENDLMLVGTDILWAELRFVVRGITEGDDRLVLRPGVVAVQEALHGKYGYTDNAYIVSCTRIRPFSMHEMADSKDYYHLGAEYNIKIRPRN